ncbi:MAG TPA: transferase [Candidatus Binatia bacterium]|nr:transferase [Candidatus Binatia bacterium]
MTPVLRDEDGELSLQFDDGVVQSRMLDADPSRLVLEYTRLMMGFLLFQPAPVRIVMIGLGGGSLAKYCAATLPEADFTAVEIASEVIALRETFGIPPDGPRFRVVCDDGADFVRRDGEPVDVLLVDGFGRGGRPERLCSTAFYADCRDRLAAGGVLVVNRYADDPIDGIREAFAERVVVVRGDASANEVVFAGADASFPPAFRVLVERRRALEGAHRVDLEAIVRKIAAYDGPSRRRR